MTSPFLLRMKRKNCEVIRKNIHLGAFKDQLISYLIATRAFSLEGEIVDIEFGLPSKGCVPLEVYINPRVKKETDEDQVVVKKSGKKRS